MFDTNYVVVERAECSDLNLGGSFVYGRNIIILKK